MLLLKQQIFAALALDRGHIAFCEKVLRGRNKTFGKLDALALQLDLPTQIGNRGLGPGDECVEALAFRCGALLLRGI